MKRYLSIDDKGQDLEAVLKLLREHGYSVAESNGDAAFLTDPPCCPTDCLAIRSARESGLERITGLPEPDTLDSAASGEVPRREESFQRVFHTSPDAMLITRVGDGAVLESNDTFTELTGYGRGEMLGQTVLSLTFFLNPELWTHVFRRLEAEGEVPDLETRVLRKDGLVVFVLVSLRNAEIEGVPCHVITIRDRSCKASKGTMAGQQGLLDPALEHLLSPDVDINREEVGRLIDFQAIQDLMNSFYKVTRIGIGINDIKGNVQVATGWQDVCTRFHRLHPETLANCLESDIYLSQNIGEGEYSLYKCRNNLWDMATPLIIGGRHIANIFLGQFFFDDEIPDYEFFRDQAERYGFDVEEYLAALDRVPRWSRETVENVMEFYTKLAVMSSKLSIGNIQLVQALAEQKRVSEELRQANLIVENGPAVLFRWKTSAGWPVEFVSDNVIQFGYTPEVFISGKVPYSAIIYPEDLDKVVSEVEEYSSRRVDRFQLEYRIVTREGAVRWVEERTVAERDEKGRMVCFQGIVIDITDRKLAEKALRESTSRLQSIFRVAPIGIGVVRDRILLEVNRRLCEMTDYRQEELVGESACLLYPDRAEFEHVGRDKYLQIGEKGTGSLETRWQRKDGSLIDIFLASTPMDPADLSKGVIFTALDITERKRAEERICASLAEKEVLLKEVHHRVKNNLQIISSLLDLQSEYIRDEQSRGCFRDSQHRIRSMALIHQKLYQSESLAFIDFREYIEDLATYLCSTLVEDPDLICLQVEVEEVSLGVDEAIPCGLIVNELVSNSLKHAFSDGRKGEISIQCRTEREGEIMLTVSDNGVGLPPGLDCRNTETLGLQLVTMLARQLRGRIAIDAEQGGTVFILTFPGCPSS